jgi:hypothetical protein
MRAAILTAYNEPLVIEEVTAAAMVRVTCSCTSKRVVSATRT